MANSNSREILASSNELDFRGYKIPESKQNAIALVKCVELKDSIESSGADIYLESSRKKNKVGFYFSALLVPFFFMGPYVADEPTIGGTLVALAFSLLLGFTAFSCFKKTKSIREVLRAMARKERSATIGTFDEHFDTGEFHKAWKFAESTGLNSCIAPEVEMKHSISNVLRQRKMKRL